MCFGFRTSGTQAQAIPEDQQDNNKIHTPSRRPCHSNHSHRNVSMVLAALTEDINTKYTFGSMLGYGAYGEVVACMEKITRRVNACKIMSPSRLLKTVDGPNIIKRLQNEIACMSYLAGHPNIIQMIDVYETRHTLFMVQEMCQGGNLMQLIELYPLEEADAATLFRGMIKAVLHCHQMGIIHRDIKPENFLLSKRFVLTKRSNAVIKLADFGLSCFHRNDVLTEAIGSPYYMAPEMVTIRKYGVAADVWSCGVCLYRMLSGQYPFDGQTNQEVFLKLRNKPHADFSKPVWSSISDEGKDLISMLLNANPEARICGEEVLHHPWMKNNQELKDNAPPTQIQRRRSSIAKQYFATGATATEVSSFSSSTSSGSSDAKSTGSKASCKVTSPTTSARVFFSPVNLNLRTTIHTFINMFKKHIEEPYIKLLQADSADDAAVEWDVLCSGMALVNNYLEENASRDGFFFLGREPSLAEAATAPQLYRMCATLPAIRDIELLKACRDLELSRLYIWLKEVLNRPSDCCDVLALPEHVYIHLARRMYVKYEGPPTPPQCLISDV